jgi:hypothetical protein
MEVTADTITDEQITSLREGPGRARGIIIDIALGLVEVDPHTQEHARRLCSAAFNKQNAAEVES